MECLLLGICRFGVVISVLGMLSCTPWFLGSCLGDGCLVGYWVSGIGMVLYRSLCMVFSSLVTASLLFGVHDPSILV